MYVRNPDASFFFRRPPYKLLCNDHLSRSPTTQPLSHSLVPSAALCPPLRAAVYGRRRCSFPQSASARVQGAEKKKQEKKSKNKKQGLLQGVNVGVGIGGGLGALAADLVGFVVVHSEDPGECGQACSSRQRMR